MLSKGKNLLLEAKVETCRLYTCVLVIMGAESRQNARCGLCCAGEKPFQRRAHWGRS